MKKVLLIIGGIFLVFIIIGMASGGSKTQTTSTKQEASDSAQKPTEQKSTEKQYVVVTELKGNANKSSDTFKLSGGKVRIIYNFTSSSSLIGAIYVLKEGTDLMKDGGIPEVMVSNAGEDSTIIRKSAGEYYLQVNAANTSYTVTVEEEK